MKNNKVVLTGLSDVDEILKNDTITNEPMPIDKELFDAVILPLIVGDTTIESKDERFEHLKNIWINYYRDYAIKENITIDPDSIARLRSKPTNVKAVKGNGVFHPMKIIDINGVVVDTTPPLLQPFLLDNASINALDYRATNNVSPGMGDNALLNIINNEKISIEDDTWDAFIKRYYLNENNNDPVEEDSPYRLKEE